MRKIIAFLVLPLLFVACSKSEDTETPQVPFDRTIIVYMSGDNNLDTEGYLTEDLKEMMTGSKDIPENCRLVAFVDRESAFLKPFIAEIRNGVCDTIKAFDTDFYSSSPDEFVSVIKTIQEKYQSLEYGLVLWGHATGWLMESDTVASGTQSMAAVQRRAYGLDYSTIKKANTPKWMNITQMGLALKQLPHFRYIFADCCCMMCAEVAYELRDATDYLIGSPCEIPGSGAPYHLIVKHLFDQSDNFYQQIIDEYYDHYYKDYQTTDGYLKGYSLPLSVVDMRYMEQLASATQSLLKNPSDFDTDGVTYYFDYDMPVMYDMGGLLEKNCNADELMAWKAVLDKAVPYRRLSRHWMTVYSQLRDVMKSNKFNMTPENYAGLSMFVPMPSYNFSSYYQYNARFPSLQWYTAVGWGRFQDY